MINPITTITTYLNGKHNIPNDSLHTIAELIMQYAINDNIPLSESNIEYMFEELFLK